jgi:glycosyltransferase involved in cell wall biosynthesis
MPRVLASVPGALLLLSQHRADEDYQRTLHQRVDALGLAARVRFVPRIEHAEMPAWYTLAEVSVNLPFSDGLPQSLFEAMACGTASLLGRLPFYAEVATDGTHVLLADLTTDAVGVALVRLLTDHALRRSLADAGRSRVLEVACLPREAARVEGFYERLRSQPRRRTSRAARALDAASLLFR